MFGFGAKKLDEVKKPKKLWFKAKTYGWGWTPITWQGWFVLIIYLLCVAYYAKDVGVSPNATNFDKLTTFFIGLGGLSVLLVWVCYKKGEKPRWSWGRKKEEGKS